jgi:hypothetical protein
LPKSVQKIKESRKRGENGRVFVVKVNSASCCICQITYMFESYKYSSQQEKPKIK